jgi:cytochrome c oxidase assembly protein subunit 11
MATSDKTRRAAHKWIPAICVGTSMLMLGGAFAAVPLYKAFCQATGFAGVVPRAKAAPGKVLGEKLTVFFDTNVRGLPWSFRSLQRSEKVHVGATDVAYFTVVNNSDKAITGRAIYNVTPDSAGWHVRKLQCFCFNAETLEPHEKVKWPVIYFIDPAYATDANMQGYSDITLSYTFVPDPQEAASARHPSPS